MSYVGELKIFPVTLIPVRPRSDLECGGKVVLPATVLDILTSRTNNIFAPMLFKLTNPETKKFTHCGVLEFIADEGSINAPSWVLDLLDFKCGAKVKVESSVLPTATFSRFQPQCVAFLDISNPKAVLENYLRNFSCLTEGDVIPIHYNNRLYQLKVEETKPSSAVAIVECDMEVDFSPPVGYVEPERPKPPPPEPDPEDASLFRPFSGTGYRLDGKKPKEVKTDTPHEPQVVRRGIPDYNYEYGTIEFFRNNLAEPSSNTKPKTVEKDFKAFSGKGRSLD
ncbi:ubiquitin recognition factor in ER-associated degradation protein 1-like isoform X2 [Cimex lectularius]|nr:ubiquitin recognition factor in ER-associated degradation protein 1-like isoform X2 [Cimex lectularius]